MKNEANPELKKYTCTILKTGYTITRLPYIVIELEEIITDNIISQFKPFKKTVFANSPLYKYILNRVSLNMPITIEGAIVAKELPFKYTLMKQTYKGPKPVFVTVFDMDKNSYISKMVTLNTIRVFGTSTEDINEQIRIETKRAIRFRIVD